MNTTSSSPTLTPMTASSLNSVDLEDEQAVPNDLIVVQPFTATDDPSVFGIKPILHINQRIAELLHKYQAENIDIEDIEYEGTGIEELSLLLAQKNRINGFEEKNAFSHNCRFAALMNRIVKPREPEIPGSGASIWKRDPVGTNG